MADQDYEKLTVVRLREIFKERGIPATGLTRKAQLIEKLREVDSAGANEEVGVGDSEGHEKGGTTGGDAPPAVEEGGEADAQQDDGETATEESKAEAHASSEEQEKGEDMKDTKSLKDDAPTRTDAPIEPAPEGAKPDEEIKETNDVHDATFEDNMPESNEAVEATTAGSVKTSQDKAADAPDATGPQVEEDDDKTTHAQATAKTDVPISPEKPHDSTITAEAAAPKHAEPSEAREQQVPSATSPPTIAERPDSKPSDTIIFDVPVERPGHIEKTGEPLQSVRSHNSHNSPNATNPPTTQDPADPPRSISPAQHAPTRSLYIRNLKRPIRTDSLRSHLQTISTSAPETADIDLYLDTLRTHAFAQFPNVPTATRARSNLHNAVWPAEPGRDKLFVDFIADEQYHLFIAQEETTNNTTRAANSKRFEVVYLRPSPPSASSSPKEEGNRRAELREANPIPSGPRQHPSTTTTTAAAAAANPTPAPAPLAGHKRKNADIDDTRRVKGKGGGSTNTPSFSVLSSHFRSTLQKPMLYYRPVPPSLADARVKEMHRRASRRLVGDAGVGAGMEDSRRYTFEDVGGAGPGAGSGVVVVEGKEGYRGSWRMVDNGPEFGLRRRPPRGGRGRGR